MSVRGEERIAEIALENFTNASDSDIQTWLLDAIKNWTKENTVTSFAPFHNFFSSTQDEIESLAQIIKALPTSKNDGQTYSISDQFRRALVDILSTKDIYLTSSDIWLSLFELASKIRLNECADSITSVVANKRFRDNHHEEDTPLFDAALRLSFDLDPTSGVLAFWQACINYINEAPHLSARLLIHLIRAKPLEWADFATDPKLSAALENYYHTQRQKNAMGYDFFFRKLSIEISELITDRVYLEGVHKLLRRNIDFLIQRDRVRALINVQHANVKVIPIKYFDRATLTSLRGRVSSTHISTFSNVIQASV